MSSGSGDYWVGYSDLDKTKYTTLVTSFSLVSSLITHPFTVLMTRQQVGVSSSSGITGSIRENISTIGLSGLYRGWLPMFVMGIPSQVAYLSIIESSREIFLVGTNKVLIPANIYTDFAQSLFSSILANTVSLIPYVPAEVLSTRLMIQGNSGIGIVNMSKQIYMENGLRGFFRGFNASLSFNVMFSAQWWWIYSSLRRECSAIEIFSRKPQLLDATTGLAAGLLTTCCMHPLDTLKTKIMASSVAKSTSMEASSSIIDVFRHVVKTEGSRALWRGLRASLYQSVIASSGFSLSYEFIKRVSIKDAAVS